MTGPGEPALRFAILGSGSAGNATYVETPRTRLLIDAGLSLRALEQRLAEIDRTVEDLDAVCVSHEHGDHIRGLPRLTKRVPLTIVASAGTHRALADRLAASCDRITLRRTGSVRLGDLEVTPIPLAHDAREPLGFRLSSGAARLGHLTDLGAIDAAVEDALAGLGALVIESNHDVELTRSGPYPWSLKRRVLGPRGHLSNEALADFLREGPIDALRLLYLAHVSETNNRPQLAAAEARLALSQRGTELELRVARQSTPSPLETVPTGRALAPPRATPGRRPHQPSLPF